MPFIDEVVVPFFAERVISNREHPSGREVVALDPGHEGCAWPPRAAFRVKGREHCSPDPSAAHLGRDEKVGNFEKVSHLPHAQMSGFPQDAVAGPMSSGEDTGPLRPLAREPDDAAAVH